MENLNLYSIEVLNTKTFPNGTVMSRTRYYCHFENKTGLFYVVDDNYKITDNFFLRTEVKVINKI